MNIPNDPMMLVSYLNTQLRDYIRKVLFYLSGYSARL